MITAAITGLIFFALVAAIIYAVSRFAVKCKSRMDGDDDHSASSELRCVTKINDQDILKGFWI